MNLTLDHQKRLEIVDEKIDSIQQNLDFHIRDTDKEIGDLGNLRMIVAANTEAINELKKTLERHVDRVSNRVVQAVEPILEESQGLRKEIKAKTIIRTTETFWQGIRKLIGRR